MSILNIEERIERIAELHTKLTEMLNDLPIPLSANQLKRVTDAVFNDEELVKLINGIKERRAPRFMMVGCTGAGKSSLINALTGRYLSETSSVVAGTTKAIRFRCSAHGKLMFEIIDTRGIAESSQRENLSQEAEQELESAIKKFEPDAILFVVSANVRAHIDDDIKELKRICQYAGKPIPVVGIITKADALEPSDEIYPLDYSIDKIKNIKRAVEQVRHILNKENIKYIDVVPVSSYIKWDKFPEGLSQEEKNNLQIKKDYRYNIDALIKLLEDNIDIKAAINLTLTYKVDLAAKKIAERILTIFVGIAGAIGAVPIPIADLPILCAIQALLVSIIAYLSGIDATKDVVVGFITSVGVIGVTGFILRLVVQQVGKLLNVIPGAGSTVSSAAASLGTYSIGRAAIAFFMDGVSKDKLDSVVEEAEREFSGLSVIG